MLSAAWRGEENQMIESEVPECHPYRLLENGTAILEGWEEHAARVGKPDKDPGDHINTPEVHAAFDFIRATHDSPNRDAIPERMKAWEVLTAANAARRVAHAEWARFQGRITSS